MPEYFEGRYERDHARMVELIGRIEGRLAEQIDRRVEEHPLLEQLQRESRMTVELLERLLVLVARMPGFTGDSNGPPRK